MPKGLYKRTEKHLKWLREHWSEELIKFNKSEAGRAQASKIGKITGPRELIKFNKSEAGRKQARRILTKYLNSSAGKEHSRKHIIERNKSEKGRETSRKNIVKVREMITTPSQKLLSKALINKGIKNKMEWWFPSIHRLGDIAIPSSKLIIEVDGSSHNGIFCTKEQKKADDKLKEKQINSLGWKVIRFKNEEIENDIEHVIEKIGQRAKT